MSEELMSFTNKLCQALQCKALDILNAMDLLVATKIRIQEFRDNNWEGLLHELTLFIL